MAARSVGRQDDNAPYTEQSNLHERKAKPPTSTPEPRRVLGEWHRVVRPSDGMVVVFLQGEILPAWAPDERSESDALGIAVTKPKRQSAPRKPAAKPTATKRTPKAPATPAGDPA